MNKHRFHTQRIRNPAGVLPASTTKALERISRHSIPALHGNFLDGVCHIFDGDAQESFGNFFRRFEHFTCRLGDFTSQFFETATDNFHIERLVCMRPKDAGKVVRLEIAQHNVTIGNS
jgi:hypothetical protein